jgi:DNA-binding MarR family transcriptional regulator
MTRNPNNPNATPDQPDAAALSRARLRTWHALSRVSRRIEADLRERLRAGYRSTLPRFEVMAALVESDDGLRMSELSARLGVSNGNITGLVERLVQDGLAYRVAVENDRRATRVRLTHLGRQLIARMQADHADWIDAQFVRLDGPALGDLDALLAKIDAPDR